MLNVIMLSVVMLSVIMLSVIRLSVMVPKIRVPIQTLLGHVQYILTALKSYIVQAPG